MAFELPQLPYAYDALEPHIDARTMEIHHSKHHQGYVNKTNGDSIMAMFGVPVEFSGSPAGGVHLPFGQAPSTCRPRFHRQFFPRLQFTGGDQEDDLLNQLLTDGDLTVLDNVNVQLHVQTDWRFILSCNNFTHTGVL